MITWRYGQMLRDGFCKLHGTVIWRVCISLEGLFTKTEAVGVEILWDKNTC